MKGVALHAFRQHLQRGIAPTRKSGTRCAFLYPREASPRNFPPVLPLSCPLSRKKQRKSYPQQPGIILFHLNQYKIQRLRRCFTCNKVNIHRL